MQVSEFCDLVHCLDDFRRADAMFFESHFYLVEQWLHFRQSFMDVLKLLLFYLYLLLQVFNIFLDILHHNVRYVLFNIGSLCETFYALYIMLHLMQQSGTNVIMTFEVAQVKHDGIVILVVISTHGIINILLYFELDVCYVWISL